MCNVIIMILKQQKMILRSKYLFLTHSSYTVIRFSKCGSIIDMEKKFGLWFDCKISTQQKQ